VCKRLHKLIARPLRIVHNGLRAGRLQYEADGAGLPSARKR